VTENTIRRAVYRFRLREKVRDEARHGNKTRLEKAVEGESTRGSDLARRIAWLRGEDIEIDLPSVIFEDSELKSWFPDVKGFERFCAQVLKIELLPWQLEAARTVLDNRFTSVLAGRGSGKDFFASAFVLWLALTRSNFKVLVVSSAQRQSDLLGNRIYSHVGAHDKLLASVSKSTQEELTLKNNSRVYLLPSSGFIRGFQNVKLAVVNEASFVPNSSEFIQTVIMPMLGTSSGKLFLMGTPNLADQSDALYWSREQPLFKHLHYPSSVNTKSITSEFLETQKSMMHPSLYQQEFEAEFASMKDLFFNPKTIQACLQDYSFLSKGIGGKYYYISWDPARSRDASAMLVLSRDQDKHLRVENIKSFYNVSIDKQESFMSYLIEKFKPQRVVIEYNGLGISIGDRLVHSHGALVQKFKATAPEKLKAYENLREIIEKGEITLPLGHRKLLTELKFFQYKLTGSGNVLLHHPPSGSDDLADALCLAAWSARKRQGGPVYFCAVGRRR